MIERIFRVLLGLAGRLGAEARLCCAISLRMALPNPPGSITSCLGIISMPSLRLARFTATPNLNATSCM